MDDLILEAIAKRRFIHFTYLGKPRVCEPHVFGVTNRAKQVLCWQSAGKTSAGSSPIPNWRRFDLDGMSDLKLVGKTFDGPRQVPQPHSLGWEKIIAAVT